MRAIDRELRRASRPARRHLALTVALGLTGAALVVAQAALLARVVDRAFLGGAAPAALAGLLAALAAVALGRALAAGGIELSGRLGAARAMSDLRRRVITHVLRARPLGTPGTSAGELAAAAVSGVDALEAYFARYLPQLVLAALVPVALLGYLLTVDPLAAGILAVTVPLIPLFMALVGRGAAAATRARFDTLARLSAHFLDVVEGLETLHAHDRAGLQAQTIAAAGERYRRETMATLRIAFLSALVLELLAMVGTALVAAAVGVQLVDGKLTLTAGLTVLLLAPELYLPVRQLGAQFHASADGLAAAGRLLEVLAAPPAIAIPARPLPAPDPARGAVRLERVVFAHPGRPQRVLDEAELELAPGELVALVGPSGAGKTTLAALLARLLDPDAGRVTCGGVDLRAVDPRAWRARLAWLPQHPTLFAGTLADNVRLGAPLAPPAAVRRALRAVGALELVGELPDGVQTRIGEGGRGLSAGQAQRVALARVLLADAPLLVLDEPTAHLDEASAAAAGEAIAAAARGRTALVISHRGALAERADRVLELRAGRVVERPRAPAGRLAGELAR